jgi:hypothetical protein
MRDRYVPIRATRAERRRWAAEDARDAARAQTERPNVPPRPDPIYDECNDSKHRTHRFVMGRKRAGLVCEFCGRAEAACVRDRT